MSQAKVDQYKKEKANRKKTMARDKVKHRCAVVATWVVLLALVGWAGTSLVFYYQEHKPVKTYYCDTTDIDNYLNDLTAE